MLCEARADAGDEALLGCTLRWDAGLTGAAAAAAAATAAAAAGDAAAGCRCSSGGACPLCGSASSILNERRLTGGDSDAEAPPVLDVTDSSLPSSSVYTCTAAKPRVFHGTIKTRDWRRQQLLDRCQN